jgi:hypothetical protein
MKIAKFKRQAILDKSARIALMVLLEHSGKPINTRDLAQITGVDIRSIQRDRHGAYQVHIRLAELLRKYNEAKGNLDVVAMAARLHLSDYRIRKLAKTLNIGQKLPNGRWLFTQTDIVLFEQRKRSRKARAIN